MEYKLIAFDMDGTFLNSNKEIPIENIEAVKRAVKENKIVAISTGRGLSELKMVREKLPEIHYMIMTSGTMVYDFKENKEIYSNQLSIEEIRKILEVSKNRDILVHFLSQKAVMEKDKGHRVKDYGMGVYQPMYNEVCTFVEDIYEYFEHHPSTLEKVNLYHQTKEDREITYGLLKDLDLSLKKAESGSLECSAKNINKGTGLKKLCEYLKIDIEETIAVGDANNDLEILEEAGLSIAMGNASDEIKRKADVVVSDHDHLGCVEAIDQYLLK